MRYRRLGGSGLLVSEVVLGSARLGELGDDALVDRVVAQALDVGVSAFDTADAYSSGASEIALGRALAHRRDQVVLCTKVGLRVGDDDAAHAAAFAPGGLDHEARWKAGIAPTDQGLSRKHILSAVEASLRRLRTDYIDVYQLHRWDPDVPIDETLHALGDLVHSGKVRYIGASGYTTDNLATALAAAEHDRVTRPISLQVSYNVLADEAETTMLPACAAASVGVLAFSVLAAGMLTGRFTEQAEPSPDSRLGSRRPYRDRYWRPDAFPRVEALRAVARDTGRTMAELACGAVLAHPAVSAVVYGVSKPEQLDDACRASTQPLSEDERAQVRAATEGEATP